MIGSIEELKSLLVFVKKLKAKTFEIENLKIEFHDSPVSVSQLEPGESVPTEDELLYWSTDYEPQLKATAPE